MRQQRPHQQRISSLQYGNTGFKLAASSFEDGCGSQFPGPMPAWQQFKPAIRSVYVIQVKAQGDHAFEELSGRFDVWHAIFDGPAAKPSHFQAFLDCNRAILMPANLPVGSRDLIKQDGTDQLHRFAHLALHAV